MRQLRRAPASIPANTAEGWGRSGPAKLAPFLQIAMGSASELEYHLLLARDLQLLAQADYERLAGDVTEIKRMLTSLIQKLTAQKRGSLAGRYKLRRYTRPRTDG